MVKTQGRRGEVAVEPHSDVPDRFQAGLKVWALAKDDSRLELEVEDVWPHKGLLILKFAGVDSISDAEELSGCELQIPAEQRAELDAGWSYISDLTGCMVLDGDREVGKIADVRYGAGEAPLLLVRSGKTEYEIPFAEAYLVKVDLERKEVRMQLPEGLLEVNAPLTAEEKQQSKKN